MSIEDLVKISRLYGKNPSFVQGGGGNTSYKDRNYLYVKASGFSLESIGKNGFVKLDRKMLNSIWEKEYPTDADLREKQALKDLLNSRAEGEVKRPSVESLLHTALPQKFIVHTHPTIINGLTCSKNGPKLAKKFFGIRCMWVPLMSPGYVLAKKIYSLLDEHKKKYNLSPDIIFLENHGIFIGSETIDNIKWIYDNVISILKEHIVRKPDFSSIKVNKLEVEEASFRIKNHYNFKDSHIIFENNKEISMAVKNRKSFKKVCSSYTPDHILYAGPEVFFLEDVEDIEKDIDKYWQRNSCYPKIIAVKHLGVFAIGKKVKISRMAMVFFLDALKIAIYAESFGGYKHMDKEIIDFIVNWEVEKFRSKIFYK